jgi:hypothetical protein
LPNRFHNRMLIEMTWKWASYHNDDVVNWTLALASDGPTQFPYRYLLLYDSALRLPHFAHLCWMSLLIRGWLRESLTTAVVGYKSGGSSIFTGVVSVSGLRIEKPLFNGI